MRNKNIWIGIGLVAAIALVAVLAMVLPTRIASPASDAPALAPDATIGSRRRSSPHGGISPPACRDGGAYHRAYRHRGAYSRAYRHHSACRHG